MRVLTIASAFALFLIGSGNPLDGGQALNVQVSPKMAPAPGWVRVTARIEPDDDNRILEISAASSEFERSSYIQLDGLRAPRLSVVDYVNLPSGIYQVSVALIGSQGPRARTTQFLQIVPMPGQR